MLSSVLKSKCAIQMNIAIMRAFVRLREMIGSNKVLARRLNELDPTDQTNQSHPVDVTPIPPYP